MNSKQSDMKNIFPVLIIVLVIVLSILGMAILHASSSIYKIRIISDTSFLVNGTLYKPGTYYFANISHIINITFFTYVYQTNFSRVQLQGVYINNTYVNASIIGSKIFNLNFNNKTLVILVNTTNITTTTIVPSYVREYYVTVNSKYPTPITSGWYIAGEYEGLSSSYFYRNGSTRYVVSNMYVNDTRTFSFRVFSPLTVNISFITEYLVNFTKPVYGYNNGTFQLLESNWYENGTVLSIPTYINTTYDTRLFTYGNLTGLIILNKPIIINDSQITQFYVKTESTIVGDINNVLTNITSNWYNISTKFFIPTTIPLKNDYRLATYGGMTGTFILYSPLVINDVQVLQYYLEFPFNVNIELPNGTRLYTNNLWVNNGSIAVVSNQTTYINDQIRAIVPLQVFNSPNFNKLNYTYQFLVTTNLPTPVTINGENITLTSGWFNQNTSIIIYKTYYENTFTRIVILSSNIKNITLGGPTYISVYYIYQYLVTIKGYYENTSSIIFSENLWEPYGGSVSIPTTYSYDGVNFNLIQGNSMYYVTSPLNITLHYAPQSPTINTSTTANQYYGKSLLIVFILIIALIIIASLLLIVAKRK